MRPDARTQVGVPAYITRGDTSNRKMIHISRHDGEHYNSVVPLNTTMAAALRQHCRPRSTATAAKHACAQEDGAARAMRVGGSG